MKFNSKQNYNYKANYNSAPYVRIVFPLEYEPVNISESVALEITVVIHPKESAIRFLDSASFSDTDFAITSQSDFDSAFDWFLPLPMKVDWANTSLQIVPTSESEYVDMPNVDGSMVQNTTYKNRSFSFVLYSNDGLSDGEKDDIKQKIAKILDRTKSGFKKLSIPPSDHYFEVKYSGSASIQDGPSFVKATLPFEVKPYSHPMFPTNQIGSGTITNNGLKACGLRIEISGPISSPSFTVKSGESSKQFTWGSSLAESEKLIIDGESMICYKMDSTGEKTNGITSLSPSGKDAFVTVNPGESIEVSPSGNASGHIIFSINESYIW